MEHRRVRKGIVMHLNRFACRRAWFAFGWLLALAAPTFGGPAEQGQWDPAFDFQNVAIHVSLLPNGKVLFWSRREQNQGLDPHNCTPRLWDPNSNTFGTVPQ